VKEKQRELEGGGRGDGMNSDKCEEKERYQGKEKRMWSGEVIVNIGNFVDENLVTLRDRIVALGRMRGEAGLEATLNSQDSTHLMFIAPVTGGRGGGWASSRDKKI